MSARYSHLKAFKYPDRIEAIREGTVAGPVHVQLILSDLCNHACSFCLTEDAVIDTISGSKPIREIRVGDFVYGPDGLLASVGKIGKRIVTEVFEISVGARCIQATAEHPILTQDGWKEAGSISDADSAVVRVRMRDVGNRASRDVERVSSSPSTETGNVGCREVSGFNVDEEEQSDEATGDRCESVCVEQRCAAPKVAGRDSEYRGGGEKADALRRQSYERPGDAQSGNVEDSLSSDKQERASLQRVVRGEKPADFAQGRRQFLDRQAQSGFQGYGTAQADRGNAEGVLSGSPQDKNGGGVWNGYDQALPQQGLGVSSRVQAGSSLHHPGEPAGGDAGLRIAGLKLERGLELQRIDSVRKRSGRFVVFNFSCKPQEAYEANGFVVHNCAYRDESSNTWRSMFAEGENHNPNRMLSFDKVIEILDDCAEMGVKGVELTGGGEPTIHKQFPQVIDAINERGLKWGLVTNGSRVQDLSSASWVRVSLDAATAETHASMRGIDKSHFKRALSTIQTWNPSVSFVVTPDNWREIYQAAVLVKSLGAQSFRIRPYQSVDGAGLFESFLEGAKLQASMAVELADEEFEVDYQLDSELDALESGKQDYNRCGFQYFKTWIGADENLYRCCIYAYSPRGLIGSIKGRRFKDVWREVAIPDFAKFSARGCENCRYAGTNRAINEVVDAGPWDAFI